MKRAVYAGRLGDASSPSLSLGVVPAYSPLSTVHSSPSQYLHKYTHTSCMYVYKQNIA